MLEKQVLIVKKWVENLEKTVQDQRAASSRLFVQELKTLFTEVTPSGTGSRKGAKG